MVRSFDDGALCFDAQHHAGDDVLVLRWSGTARLEGVLAASDASYDHPSLTGSSCVIHDLTDVDFGALSSDDVHYIAGHPVDPAPPAGLRVAVLSSGDVGYGLARMLQVLADDGRPLQVAVHRTLDDALEWARSTRP